MKITQNNMNHFNITKKIFISILALAFSQISLAQNPSFEWAKRMGGTGDDRGHSITTDNSGNIYTTGYFSDTVDFDPGAGYFNLISAGENDIFIQKLNASGNLIWVKQMGGSLTDHGLSITIDNSGNVYTTGFFEGTADFDPGVGTTNLTSIGASDIFIQKLDTFGNLLWVKQMGGSFWDEGLSITIDNNGNIYTTGLFSITVDFDPGAGTTNLTSAGDYDIFIQKLDALGNLLWAKQMGGSTYDIGYSITTDNSGNIYTTGYFEGTVDFNPGVGTTNLTSAGFRDIFIQKLDSSGNLLWIKQMGGNNYDFGYSLTIDNKGNIYTTGWFSGTADFDPGTGTTNLTSVGFGDIFIQKLDASGNLVWVKQMGGFNYDCGNSITIDNNWNVYTTGFFHGTVDFDPGTGIANLTSIGNGDTFIQKLDASGNLVWVKQMGGTASTGGKSITTDTNENLYTIGYFNGTSDFDPGAGTTNLTSVGDNDIFIQKLSQCSVDISLTTTDPSILANAIGASYKWLDCNNNYSIIPGATAQSYTATANGDYAVEVTQNNCVDTSVCVTISTVGISENPIFKGVSIYPNPTQNIVNINLGNLRDVSLKVFNIQNQLIYHKESINTPIYKFELKEAAGVYLIELSTDGEKQQYKLIKGL